MIGTFLEWNPNIAVLYVFNGKSISLRYTFTNKPYDMSLLLFHQGNVPIIEDDMKFAEIKLENNKTSGKS